MKLPDWLKLIKGDMSADDDEPVDMMLTEPIGYDSMRGEGVSSRMFGEALSSIPKKKTVNLLINTLGGRIDQGTAMYHMIRARGNVNTVVIGFAASMGSIIAQAGATRKMMPGTAMIVHNPQGGADGEERDVQAAANALRVMKDNLLAIYHDSTRISKKKLSDMMDATTTMTPEEAEELGFCDEVVTDSPAWNSLVAPPSRKDIFSIFRQLNGAVAEPAAEVKPKKENTTMKLLIASLAKSKLLPTADLTDEQAIVTHFENSFGALGLEAMRTENATLKTKVTAFEAAQKTRVTTKITNAITVEKIVKEDRRTALVEMGVRDEAELDNYLADLLAVKKDSTPAQRRGAPPVPLTGKVEGEEGSTEEKIKNLQNDLKTASASEKVTISRQIRELRGHASLFEAPASKN